MGSDVENTPVIPGITPTSTQPQRTPKLSSGCSELTKSYLRQPARSFWGQSSFNFQVPQRPAQY